MKSAAAEQALATRWWPRMWPERRVAAPVPPRQFALAADEVDRHAVRMIAIGTHTTLHRFGELATLLQPGDLVVINDAATLPGSLFGTVRGEPIELRLTGPVEGKRLDGVLFGGGDWRTRTEDRPPPPSISVGDRLVFGALDAIVRVARGRRIAIEVECEDAAIWQALYATGAPVQYAHRHAPLDLWSVQTAYAARPWAAEMPSAGRPLTWEVLLGLRRAGIAIATLTHAAGLSSTGDAELDRALPWPERYDIPDRTAEAIARAKRVIAVGTTVVRALEASGGRAGQGVALLKLDAAYQPRIVDGLVSGLHVPGESHHELLRAFASRDQLERGLALAEAHHLSAHELGDAMLIMPAA
jgi:S-adenosylmethionine:tRNA ribosyltransferase-isomerase